METIKQSEQYIDSLPPSKELVALYKSKLKKCQKELLDLRENYDSLRRELNENISLHSEMRDVEDQLCRVNGILSETQALLLVERANAQQMALHIDLLRKQHKIDREKLDLLLSLNGKPLPPSAFNEETILKQQIVHMDRILKEQASQLMEERCLMKAEWEKDQQKNEKIRRALKEKLQNLQEAFLQLSQNRIDFNIQEIADTILGKFKRDNHLADKFDINLVLDGKHPVNHCTAQEFKLLQRKVKELSEERDLYQKKVLAQANLVHEINDNVKAQQEKYQAQLKAMREQVEILREENNQLNKRRMNEGAGFRSEIRLLREQLQRTQRQLCFLSVKKYDV